MLDIISKVLSVLKACTCVSRMLTDATPTGNLLWKVEQKSMTAFACAKVSAKGKRHWYKAVEETAFVALSDDSAWIIRTNGDLYLQTGNGQYSIFCCRCWFNI